MVQEIRYKGITAVPNDYVSEDGDLHGSTNVVPDGGGLSPLPEPSPILQTSSSWRVVLKHDVKPSPNYIGIYSTNRTLAIVGASSSNTFGSTSADIIQVTAIGNTLVVLTEAGTEYFLWKEGSYQYLGQKPAELDLLFGVQPVQMSSQEFSDSEYIDKYQNSSTGYIFVGEAMDYVDNHSQLVSYLQGNRFANNSTDVVSDEEDRHKYNNLIKSAMNKFIADFATNKGRFIYPFQVRYAYRMYDGTLWMHSSPQLMVTSTGLSPVPTVSGEGLGNTGDPNHKITIRVRGRVFDLYVKRLTDTSGSWLSNWSDIITGVAVFASAPFYSYDQADTREVDKMVSSDIYTANQQNTFPNYSASSSFMSCAATAIDTSYKQPFPGATGADSKYNYYILKAPEHDDVSERIRDNGLFYLLKEWTLDEAMSLSSSYTKIEIPDDYLQSLVNRERMTDDYDSHDTLLPTYAYGYNARLHLAGESKIPYEGYHPGTIFPALGITDAESINVVVSIKTGTGTVMVKKTLASDCNINQNRLLWFYYPNPNATDAYIQKGSSHWHVKLKPHEALNGAVWFNDFAVMDSFTPTVSSPFPTATTNPRLDIQGKVYTTEANNPFVFPLSGIVNIGNVRVLAMAAATKALSQGQFGQFPLYAFTSEGVWALELSGDGSYTARQPVTRDVLLSPESLVGIDDAVVFATARGLLLLQGSKTVSISDALTGDGLTVSDGAGGELDFLEFVDGCRIVYDYPHQRLVVYNPKLDGQSQPLYGSTSFVYSIDSQSWGQMTHTRITSSVPSYPEALVMIAVETTTTNNGETTTTVTPTLVDLSAAGSSSGVTGELLTRPLKLEAPDLLKTVRTVMQRGKFARGHITGVVLEGSRDLFHWHRVYSSRDHRLRGFSGTPYKYFRLKVVYTLSPGESLVGCTVQFEPKYTMKVR